ncbi:acetyl transferase GW6a-like [Typha angustifolia]|uniref:acetyl transferase GW6a-like n=1 Tax=Typha angustifolia TaxID=59011 RepID=UPI003C2D8E7B
MVMKEEEKEKEMIRVREFDMERDLAAVEELERRCEVGPTTAASDATAAAADTQNKKKKKKNKKNKRAISLYVDQLGDPLSRVRHAPEYVMLVAEYGEKKEMVGVIRACIKMVSSGRPSTSPLMAYVKVAYILGLRVSPSHRCLGIATMLVEDAERWCSAAGAAYAYMATTASNSASLSLFTRRLSYAPFRRPVLLGHPVHAHLLPLRIPHHSILRFPPPLAAALYSHLLPSSAVEFLPSDLPSLLSHKYTVGTYLTLSTSSSPPSFAILSVWDSTHILSFRVAGSSAATRAAVSLLRAADTFAPWLRLPSIPNVFLPFGAYVLYGLHMSGPDGPHLLRSLCRFAHNLAVRNPSCGVVVAEVAPADPVRAAIPHWRRFSCDEDVWCIKPLRSNPIGDDDVDGWLASPPSTSNKVMFVDPRDF